MPTHCSQMRSLLKFPVSVEEMPCKVSYAVSLCAYEIVLWWPGLQAILLQNQIQVLVLAVIASQINMIQRSAIGGRCCSLAPAGCGHCHDQLACLELSGLFSQLLGSVHMGGGRLMDWHIETGKQCLRQHSGSWCDCAPPLHVRTAK